MLRTTALLLAPSFCKTPPPHCTQRGQGHHRLANPPLPHRPRRRLTRGPREKSGRAQPGRPHTHSAATRAQGSHRRRLGQVPRNRGSPRPHAQRGVRQAAIGAPRTPSSAPSNSTKDSSKSSTSANPGPPPSTRSKTSSPPPSASNAPPSTAKPTSNASKPSPL